MTTVDGRPMLAALQMLLGPDRLFEGGASNTRLRPLMEQSRKEQNEVSTRLAEQVLEKVRQPLPSSAPLSGVEAVHYSAFIVQ
jgi:hypothetical protein